MRFKTSIVPTETENGEERLTLTAGLAQALGLQRELPDSRAQDVMNNAVSLALLLAAFGRAQAYDQRPDEALETIDALDGADVEIYRGNQRVLVSIEVGPRPAIRTWHRSHERHLSEEPELLARVHHLLDSVFLLGELDSSQEQRLRELRGEGEPE